MSGVQCVSCLLADVGSAICDRGLFPSVSDACLSFLCNRFASDPKHVAAVISYGSANTHNALAEASEPGTAYAHVEVVRAFLPIDWQLLTELGRVLRPGGNPSDPLDACIVATDLYEKTFSKQIAAKKLECCFFLLSAEPFVVDADGAAVRQHLTELGIRVVQIVPGSPTPDGGVAGGFVDRELCLSAFASLTRVSVPVRSKKTVTKCRVPLELSPSVKVLVFVYILAKQEPLPTLHKRLKLIPKARRGVADLPQYAAVSTERFLYRSDDPERRPVAVTTKGEVDSQIPVGGAGTPEIDSVAYAFPLGKQLVPISAFEKDAHFSLKTEKGLVLLGVLPLSSIRRWWCDGQSELVVAAEGDAVGSTAVACVFWSCVRLRCGLLCRYTPYANSLPRPVLLVPRLCCQEQQTQAMEEQTIQQSFCLLHLPFADDVDCCTFPLPPPSTEKEVAAVGALVDSLLLTRPTDQQQQLQQHCDDPAICKQLYPLCASVSLSPAADGPPFSSAQQQTHLPQSSRVYGDEKHIFNPLNVPNPALQRFLRLLTDKIRAVAATQQQQQTETPEKPRGFEEMLNALDQLFPAPLPSCDSNASTSAAAATAAEATDAETKAVFDGPAAAVASLFPLVAEGPLRDVGAAAAAAAASAQRDVSRKEEVISLEDVKLQHHLKVKAGAVETPQLTRSEKQTNQQKHSYSVSSLNPVRDFEMMLAVKETDLTERAICGMQQIILELLLQAQEHCSAAKAAAAAETQLQQVDGMTSRYLVKAMMCLEVLRAGCVRELEGQAFNAFLRQLQQQAVAEAAAEASGVQPGLKGAKLFWDSLLLEKQLPLVSTKEDPRADVLPEHALSIYASQQQQPLQEQQDTTLDDILDVIQ